MNITATQGGLSTVNSPRLSAQLAQSEIVSKNEGSASSMVNITDEAKQLAANTQPGNGAAFPNVPAGEYPVEYYSMPQWQADLMPVKLSGTLGSRADETYVKGGHLVGKYDSELREYDKLLKNHLQTLMKTEGIDSVPKYHQAMVLDKESSEKLRLLIKESVAGDKRMTELMNVLGITFPG